MAKDEIKQNYQKPPGFDAYNKELPVQMALGTARVQSRIEQATWQSANFISGVQGYKFTPTTFEINSFSFAAGSIPFTSLQSMTDGKLLGRSAGSSGNPQEITVGTGLSLSGGTLSSTITQYTDEQAQDAVGTILTDTDTIDFTYNDGTPSIIADVRKQMSITSDASGLKLSGDATTPGNSKYYGTDSGGTKGYFSFSSNPIIKDTVSLTAQVADIVATDFLNSSTAGLYRISYYLETTTIDAGAGTVTATFTWVDTSGNTRTFNSTAVSLNSASFDNLYTFMIDSASGVPNYAVTNAGGYGTADYAFFSVIEKLS